MLLLASAQIHGIGGCQGAAGRLEGEPGLLRGPGAEQRTQLYVFDNLIRDDHDGRGGIISSAQRIFRTVKICYMLS